MLTGCKKYVWLLLAIVMTASTARAEYEDRYLLGDSMPNPVAYLPPPPDSLMVASNGDYVQWLWGKTMRNTERGMEASLDSKYGIMRMCAIYSEILDLNISEEETPAIYRLMLRAGETGSGGVSAMKHAHFRRRPFLVMNEPTWGAHDSEEDLSNNSSYPSSHTGCGWGTALALAEMAPHLQDTILRRGYEYGISRVITGAHWQSDVDAAMHCASAAIARSHYTDDFQNDMIAARNEYMQLKGLSTNDIQASYPDINKVLNLPPTVDDYNFMGDLFKLWKAKDLRSTPRGEQAVADASTDDDYFIEKIAACSPVVTISDSNTPNIVMLIKMLKLMLNPQATSMKNSVKFRKRPYMQFNVPFNYYSEETELYSESSYPSRHAFIGWGLALALIETMPDCQNDILKWGYEYGESRIIKGMNYASDVQAARVMAACYLIKLHSLPLFTTLLNNAQNEYKQKIEDSGVDIIMAESELNPSAWYSINGVIYTTQPTQPGIYIHNGKKVVVRN